MTPLRPVGRRRLEATRRRPRASRDSLASSRARRALLIVDSILPRWRTMPASFSRRATSRAPKRATASTSKPAERGAEALALAQDREPAQAGLEALEADLLEEPAVVGDGEAPLLVVVAAVERVAARPEAADDAVVAARRGPSARRAMRPGG